MRKLKFLLLLCLAFTCQYILVQLKTRFFACLWHATHAYSQTMSDYTIIYAYHQSKIWSNSMTHDHLVKTAVNTFTVSQEHQGRRLDNFLLSTVKKVPKSLFYRLIRKGAIRLNQERAKPDDRLQTGDIVRIPKLQVAETVPKTLPSQVLCDMLKKRILYEDNQLIVLNKPAGLAVHGGTGIRCSIMDAFGAMYPDLSFLGLVHRLDRDTSGCLLIAKDRKVLEECHQLLKSRKIKKLYCTLTKGHWEKSHQYVETYLAETRCVQNLKMMKVADAGKIAISEFRLVKAFKDSSLMEVELHTGRTHQIRAQAQFMGHPIAGDTQYGDYAFNRTMRKKGLRRLFLHASHLEFTLPSRQQSINISAPLDDELEMFLRGL